MIGELADENDKPQQVILNSFRGRGVNDLTGKVSMNVDHGVCM